MLKKLASSWKEIFAIAAISGISLFILIYPGSPAWLRAIVLILATFGPFFPILALIPWHFIAKHRGLTSRSRIPCVVSCANGMLHVGRGNKRARHALDRVVRARLARNDNWTESNMLEDALGLFAAKGREIERVPESAMGFNALLIELNVRGIPIEQVDVSAPTMLD
ncbi:MAG TPA: hypothetical protein PK156_43535 [Polyangium sp.]|nr:hypothetical protein [Polyangium sp.]